MNALLQKGYKVSMLIAEPPKKKEYSDLPDFFRKSGGAVIGTAINKYIYHTASHFPSELSDYSVKIAYSKVECVQSTSDISHAPFREILKYMGIDKDIEIHIASDLPSFSGLGTSSAFTVGLLKCLHAFKGHDINSPSLALEAIKIEHEILKESVGCQDQAFAAYGGFRLMNFSSNGDLKVQSINIKPAKYEEISASLMLFFTGITRRAALVEESKIKNIAKINSNLKSILNHVDIAYNILTGNQSAHNLGLLLDKTW
jgi:D-glycero-alpha-D-manno-heptose-7-phosphate kinase